MPAQNGTAAEPESIFRWDTLKEIGPHALRHEGQAIAGRAYEIELTSGKTALVWRSEDGQHYFCHGLTFGGKEAPGGAISPYTGWPVETILQHHFQLVPEEQAQTGDVLVWWGLVPETTPHSATLAGPRIAQGKKYLDYSSPVRTKNGLAPETETTLLELIDLYGELYNIYRRR